MCCRCFGDRTMESQDGKAELGPAVEQSSWEAIQREIQPSGAGNTTTGDLMYTKKEVTVHDHGRLSDPWQRYQLAEEIWRMNS